MLLVNSLLMLVNTVLKESRYSLDLADMTLELSDFCFFLPDFLFQPSVFTAVFFCLRFGDVLRLQCFNFGLFVG